MNSGLSDIIFSNLKLSKDKVLNEVALLSAYQRLSEYTLEIEYFENKYKATFDIFNKKFTSGDSSFDQESDWLSWKFAVEGKTYWTSLLKKVQR